VKLLPQQNFSTCESVRLPVTNYRVRDPCVDPRKQLAVPHLWIVGLEIRSCHGLWI